MKKRTITLRVLAVALCAALLCGVPASAKYVSTVHTATQRVVWSKAIHVISQRVAFNSSSTGFIGDNGGVASRNAVWYYLDIVEGINDGWYFVYLKGGMGGAASAANTNGAGGKGGEVWGFVKLTAGAYTIRSGSVGFHAGAGGLWGGAAGAGTGGGGGGSSVIFKMGVGSPSEYDTTTTNVVAIAGGGGGGGGNTTTNLYAGMGGNGGVIHAGRAPNVTYITTSGNTVAGYYGYGGNGWPAGLASDAANRNGNGTGTGVTPNGDGGKEVPSIGTLGGTNGTLFNGGAAVTSGGGGGAGYYGGQGGKNASGNNGPGGGGGGSSFLRNEKSKGFESHLMGDLAGAPSQAAIEAYVTKLVEYHQGSALAWGSAVTSRWDSGVAAATTVPVVDHRPQVLLAYLGPDDPTTTAYTVVE